MITDPEHPLVQALAGTQSDVVYLPVRSIGVNKGAEKSESTAGRQNVVEIASEYFESADRLHGDRVPETTIMSEKPIHRMMIYLHARGASVADIANHTGYHKQTVSQILRQPWARQRLLQILNECGIDHVKHFLTHEVAPSLEVLREVRDTAAKPSDRTAAANAILDRALGKPTVHIESDNTTRNVPADMQRIDAEIAAVRKQLEGKGEITGAN